MWTNNLESDAVDYIALKVKIDLVKYNDVWLHVYVRYHVSKIKIWEDEICNGLYFKKIFHTHE